MNCILSVFLKKKKKLIDRGKEMGHFLTANNGRTSLLYYTDWIILKISATREGDVVKYHIIVGIQCLFRAQILHKFLTSHANIYTPPGCSMPLMADGEWLTLGRVPSREREKDEERESERAGKEN